MPWGHLGLARGETVRVLRPSDGILTHAEQPGELGDGAPIFVAQAAHFGALLGREGRGPATHPTAAPGGGKTLVRALGDPLALELGDRGEDMEHQAPGRCGGVDVLGQGLEARARRLDPGDDPEKVLERAAEAVVLV